MGIKFVKAPGDLPWATKGPTVPVGAENPHRASHSGIRGFPPSGRLDQPRPPDSIHSHIQAQPPPCPVSFTFLFPPPGTWVMLSRDPIFDWTLSLKSSFSDFTSTWPPPGTQHAQELRAWNQGYARDSAETLSPGSRQDSPLFRTRSGHRSGLPQVRFFVSLIKLHIKYLLRKLSLLRQYKDK